MHQDIERAIQEIDAAFFSSDTFCDIDDLEVIDNFVLRWRNEIESIKAGHLQYLKHEINKLENIVPVVKQDITQDS